MENSEAEGFPSGSDYINMLVLNDEMFNNKIKTLKNGEVIDLYNYARRMLSNEDSLVDHERLEEIIGKMEKMTIINCYLNNSVDLTDKKCMSDNYSNVDVTIELLEKRKNPSLGQRIINYFKG